MYGQRPGQLRPVSKVHRPRRRARLSSSEGRVWVCSSLMLAAGFPDAAGTDTPLAIVQHRFRKQMQRGNGAERWQ